MTTKYAAFSGKRAIGVGLVAAFLGVGCFGQGDVPLVQLDPDADAGVDADVGTDAGVESDAIVGIEVASGAHIVAIAADADRLYWIETGTTDTLGNYNDDGALRSRAHAGGAVTTLASGLSYPGPIAVTSGHVYLGLGGIVLANGTRASGVVRVPIAGGAIEPIEVLPVSSNIAHLIADDDRAFWSVWTPNVGSWNQSFDIHSASSSYTTASVLVTDVVGIDVSITAGAGFLYYGESNPHYYDSTHEVRRIPVGGGASELALDLPSASAILIEDDRIYAFEILYQSCGIPSYLTRYHVGSTPARVARLGQDCWASFRKVADRVLIEEKTAMVQAQNFTMHVWGGSLDADTEIHGYGSIPVPQEGIALATPAPLGFYWSDGSTIWFHVW